MTTVNTSLPADASVHSGSVTALEIDRSAMPEGCVVHVFGPQHLAVGFDMFEVGDRLAVPGFPLGFFDTVHHLPVVRQASIASSYGVHSSGMDMATRDTAQDESLGLNCAWYADVLMTLTAGQGQA